MGRMFYEHWNIVNHLSQSISTFPVYKILLFQIFLLIALCMLEVSLIFVPVKVHYFGVLDL